MTDEERRILTMPTWPSDRTGQYFLALAVVALVLFARTGLLYDDIRTALEVAGLVFGVPLLTYGACAAVSTVSRTTTRLGQRLDRLLELRPGGQEQEQDQDARAAPRLARRSAGHALPPDADAD
jgi:hypothetical protein